jgi:hypothetical protein
MPINRISIAVRLETAPAWIDLYCGQNALS